MWMPLARSMMSSRRLEGRSPGKIEWDELWASLFFLENRSDCGSLESYQICKLKFNMAQYYSIVINLAVTQRIPLCRKISSCIMLDPQGAGADHRWSQVGIAAPLALELLRALKIKEEDLEVKLTAVTAFWTETKFGIHTLVSIWGSIFLRILHCACLTVFVCVCFEMHFEVMDC
jgi:hypothetical protein